MLMDRMFTKEEENNHRCSAFRYKVRGSRPPQYKDYESFCSVRMEIIQRCVCAFYPECTTMYFNSDLSYTNAYKKIIHTRGQKMA